jgi:hypothetical protein
MGFAVLLLLLLLLLLVAPLLLLLLLAPLLLLLVAPLLLLLLVAPLLLLLLLLLRGKKKGWGCGKTRALALAGGLLTGPSFSPSLPLPWSDMVFSCRLLVGVRWARGA